MTGKDVYLQMTWSWPDKTWNILCSYCLQWNTSQSKFRNHYFLFLFAFSILSQLFLIWGCTLQNRHYPSWSVFLVLCVCTWIKTHKRPRWICCSTQTQPKGANNSKKYQPGFMKPLQRLIAMFSFFNKAQVGLGDITNIHNIFAMIFSVM